MVVIGCSVHLPEPPPVIWEDVEQSDSIFLQDAEISCKKLHEINNIKEFSVGVIDIIELTFDNVTEN